MSTDTTDDLLAEVIHVLATACLEQDDRAAAEFSRKRRDAAVNRLLGDSGRMDALAAHLVRSMTVRDLASLDGLLAKVRRRQDWRLLAIALAGIAARTQPAAAPPQAA
jgi:hypothetical protein